MGNRPSRIFGSTTPRASSPRGVARPCAQEWWHPRGRLDLRDLSGGVVFHVLERLRGTFRRRHDEHWYSFLRSSSVVIWGGSRHGCSLRDAKRAEGVIELERARVRWLLSVDSADLPFVPVPGGIDPHRVARAITDRTKAVIAVDLFGQMAVYEALEQVVAGRDITIIQDAAQSFGAERHGRRIGKGARISSTSFFPAKPLGCYSDGGALLTDDPEVAHRMRAIRTHGDVQRHSTNSSG